MKKAFSYIIIFLIFILVYQFIVIFFERSHEVTYKINSSEKEFTVQETYNKKADEDGYFFKIKTEKNKEYSYYIDNNYNKQKRIIKKIEYYEKDDYLCIYPITNYEKEEFEILCSDGKEIYSYDYLNKKIDISEFLTRLKLVNKYQPGSTTKEENNGVYYYKNNFYDNEYLSLYRYKYLTVYKKESLNNYSFSNKDVYTNKYGVYIDNYFLVPIFNDNKIESEYLVVDAKLNQSETIIFENPLSNNLYNIGVLDNKLYIFDLTYKKEYAIKTNGSYETIGSVEEGFKMYENGEWVDKSITEFTTNKITFKEDNIDVKLKYEYDKIYETKNYYYIISGNKLYKIYKKNLDSRILLLELNNYNNLQIDSDRIYYISDRYLYRYDQYGVKLLVDNNEFKYNNTNIYHMYNDIEKD